MKNGKLFWLMMALLPMTVQAQQDKKSIREGNEYYRQQQYDEAAAAYQRSLGNSGAKGLESVVGNFNLGAAWYKQKKMEDAVQQFTDIAESASDKSLKAKAYHNLGNALLESQKLEESIEAYKQSLLNNPKDDETRYNLAYAQEKLKQQQQNNQDQNNKDQDQQNKDEENKDQDNQGQDQQNKDDKNKDQDNKDQDQQNNDEKNKDQNKDQQQPQSGQLSKADAERLLEAMNQEEKNTQEKLKKKKGVGQGKVVKQW